MRGSRDQPLIVSGPSRKRIQEEELSSIIERSLDIALKN
jgi:hypothetical protein